MKINLQKVYEDHLIRELVGAAIQVSPELRHSIKSTLFEIELRVNGHEVNVSSLLAVMGQPPSRVTRPDSTWHTTLLLVGKGPFRGEDGKFLPAADAPASTSVRHASEIYGSRRVWRELRTILDNVVAYAARADVACKEAAAVAGNLNVRDASVRVSAALTHARDARDRITAHLV